MNHFAAQALYYGLPVVSYLLGSIPWGLIIARHSANYDIRRQGSGNIGSTNVYRRAGLKPAVITLVADVLKGLIPAGLALALTTGSEGDLFKSLVVLCAVSGHLFPVYLKFKDGGKGVATATGGFLIIAPLACAVAIILFLAMVVLTKRVSPGSLTASALLPFLVWLSTGSVSLTGCAGIAAGLIIIRHLPNIKRLISGTEPTIHS